MYAVSAEDLAEVTLSAPDRKLYAYRWDAQRPFTLLVASRTEPRTTACEAGPGFSRWLDAVTQVPIVRPVATDTPDPAGSWAELRLRDASTLEPITVDVLLPAADTGRMVVRVGGRRYLTGVEAGVLRTVDGGCASLGTGPNGPPRRDAIPR